MEMDDDLKAKIEDLMVQTLTLVDHGLNGARSEIKSNPLAVPRGLECDPNFRSGADFGLYVAQAIIQKIQARLEFRQSIIN